jgi:hypothetical protein
LILENPHNENTDFKNWYNPDKYNNPTAYIQKNGTEPVMKAKNGVVPES